MTDDKIKQESGPSGVRINKYLSEAGVLSRRKADQSSMPEISPSMTELPERAIW